MNCEEVAVELSGGEPSSSAREHLSRCASCTETAKLLGLAALPPVSESEKLLLSSLAATTQKAWREQQSRSSSARRFGSLALAAGLGALLASGVVMKLMPAPETKIVTQTQLIAVPENAAFDTDDFNLSDDDVFFEVGWPSPTDEQGEL
ncbi:MAG: hypothetical protein JNM17_09320 [Archangium sp.]|nr:hypothetical protein [Archangium sp.]